MDATNCHARWVGIEQMGVYAHAYFSGAYIEHLVDEVTLGSSRCSISCLASEATRVKRRGISDA